MNVAVNWCYTDGQPDPALGGRRPDACAADRCTLVLGKSGAHGRDPLRPNGRENGQAGTTLVEMMIAMVALLILLGLVFQSFATLTQVTSQQSLQSDAISRARGAMETVVNSLRGNFVEFNIVSGTPLGVNFDLNDANGNPAERGGILYYFDANHTANLYNNGQGQPITAGLDDANGDGYADVIGIGMVVQNLNIPELGYGNNGRQDFIDLVKAGVADDLDGDGNPDPLWTLTMVHFNSINDVSKLAYWQTPCASGQTYSCAQTLATNLYIRRLLPSGPLSGYNMDTFQFSAHNASAMVYDQTANGGNADGTAEQNEIGNMVSVDGVINAANEVASIDSITITLHVAELVNKGTGRVVVQSNISSDVITPLLLELMRRNGIVGLPDATQPVNIN